MDPRDGPKEMGGPINHNHCAGGAGVEVRGDRLNGRRLNEGCILLR